MKRTEYYGSNISDPSKVYVFPNGGDDGFSIFKSGFDDCAGRGLPWGKSRMSHICLPYDTPLAVRITRKEAEKIVGRKRLRFHVWRRA